MRFAIVLAAVLIAQVTGSWEGDAKATGQALASDIEKCPARVVVANFGKDGWGKTAWGPPINVDYDVLKTSSLRWPYQIVVSFTITIITTKNSKNKEEVEKDTKPSLVIKTLYKNNYEMGDDGSLRLSETLVQPTSLNGSSAWRERPRWPDACWDRPPKSE